MPFSRITLGVSVGLSVAACAHTASGPPPSTPEAATSAATVDEPLEMEGTCSITKESRVRTYTYSSGRLTASSNSDGVHTTYTYDEGRLVSIDRFRDGEVEFREALEYDALDRLVEVERRELGDTDMLEVIEHRALAYDDGGRLQQVTHIAADGAIPLVCACAYDERGLLESLTCATPTTTERSTFEYDEAGRLTATSASRLNTRVYYDAEGRRERAVLTEGDAHVMSIVSVRDGEGRERERRTTFPRGNVVVEVIAFEGTFDPRAECGGFPPPPPGIPMGAYSVWFGAWPL